jgi:tetratricopeptide (TPR) repeat protein
VSDDAPLTAALERLLADAATDADALALQQALRAGQIVVGSGNVTAGGDIVDSNIVQIASAEAMEALLNRLCPRRVNTLPPAPGDFTGRVAEIERLIRQITEAAVLIASIRGLGGVGKTSLALEVAHRLAPRHPDAALYLNLRGASDAPLTIREAQSQIIHAFDLALPIPGDDREVNDLYRRNLAGKSGLLLLDDARAGSQVRPLLPPDGWSTIVTSRQHFALPGASDPIDMDSMSELDARIFLQKIAPRLTGRNVEADEIAGLCGHLPLALRLAGSFLQSRPSQSAAEYIHRLTDEARRIERLDAARRLDPEQPGIEATLQLSYDLLTPELRERLRQLAVFMGDFDASAIASVWGLLPEGGEPSAADFDCAVEQAVDLIGDLSDFSLVEANQAGRYRLHDLVRLFARHRSTDSEHVAAASRHALHYAMRLRAAADLLRMGNDGILRGLALADADWTNIRSGQSWSASHAEETEMAALLTVDYAVPAADVLELRLHHREQVAWLEAALTSARRLGDPLAESSILGNIGVAYFNLGDSNTAIDYYQQSLTTIREIGAKRGEAGALINLGNANLKLGETQIAADYFQQALSMMRDLGDRRGELSAISGLGQAAQNLGDVPAAISRYQEALSTAGEIGDTRSIANALGNLGNAYLWIGGFRQMVFYLQQALPLMREMGDRSGEAATLNLLGYAFTEIRMFDQAIGCFETGLMIARELGDRRGEGICLGGIGSVYLHDGDFSEAIGYFEQAAEISRETRDRRTEVTSYANLGKAHSGVGDCARALEFHEKALAIARELGDVRLQGTILGNLAHTHGESGNLSAAVAAAEAALVILVPLQDQDVGRILRQLQGWRARLSRQNRPAPPAGEAQPD